MQQFEGHLNATGHKYGITVARFNFPVTDLLLKGAVDCLIRHGVSEDAISVAWVPGAFEIPIIAKKMAESKKYDAVIAIGCLIKGETKHFEYVSAPASSGVMEASLSTGVPVIYAILNVDTKEQAEVRAGTKGTNLGFNYAESAIEMVNLIKKLEGHHSHESEKVSRMGSGISLNTFPKPVRGYQSDPS